MLRIVAFALALAAVSGMTVASDTPVTFKSDVAMTRVDAQVVDGMGRPITGLQANDFVLRVDGKVQKIRNFASETMPLDVLLLLDVSGSMEPHVQRIADASERALSVLAPQDRVAVMVFDSRTKLRLPFRFDHGEVSGELHRVIDSERFNGGTRVTHALLDAAKYIQKEARPEARRAIVILTDDQTQDGEAGVQVQQALDEANAVLSFLQAPYDDGSWGGRRRGSSGPWGGPPTGGGGPWGGPTWPGGTRFPGGGSRLPGGVIIGNGDPSHSAGTAAAAKDSGGDVMRVEEASAFQDTLERLRQRYALHFYWPEGPANPEQRTVMVALSRSAGARYGGSEVRYRRAYVANQVSRRTGGLTEISRAADPEDPPEAAASTASEVKTGNNGTAQPVQVTRRRVAVNDNSNLSAPSVDRDSSVPQNAGSTTSTQPAPAKRGGWPRVDQQKPQP